MKMGLEYENIAHNVDLCWFKKIVFIETAFILSLHKKYCLKLHAVTSSI